MGCQPGLNAYRHRIRVDSLNDLENARRGVISRNDRSLSWDDGSVSDTAAPHRGRTIPLTIVSEHRPYGHSGQQACPFRRRS